MTPHTHVYVNAQRKRMGLILDNGCMRNVGGAMWHRDMQAMLKTKGLQPIRLDLQEEFLFGSDRVDMSKCAWLYPVGIHGRTGVINIAEIESNCPGLLSNSTMGQLDVSINTGRQTYHIGAYDVWDHKYPVAPSGHAMVHVDDFGDLTQLDPGHFIERSELPIRKGTAKRLRKAAMMVADVFPCLPCLDKPAQDSKVESTTKPASDPQAPS